MPDFETMDLEQDAVYWRKSGDNQEGLPLYATPIQLAVRWVETGGTIKDPKGNSISTDGDLACDQELVEQSLIWPGTLAQWQSIVGVAGTGWDGSNVFAVMQVVVTPDIKNRNTRWSAKVMRYSDRLPNP
jgi:hypothetical protein